MNNIPVVKLGLIAVSRDCFPESLSVNRRKALVEAYTERFDGPCMYVAAAEGDGDMINGRGDAYCGMLNCSYNLKMRHLEAYIPEYPVGRADDIAKMIADFVPVARAVIGVRNLKIITFGPRPQDFFACNAPIKGLYELGVEIEENSELDLLVASSYPGSLRRYGKRDGRRQILC